jgi:hypothetical protein
MTKQNEILALEDGSAPPPLLSFNPLGTAWNLSSDSKVAEIAMDNRVIEIPRIDKNSRPVREPAFNSLHTKIAANCSEGLPSPAVISHNTISEPPEILEVSMKNKSDAVEPASSLANLDVLVQSAHALPITRYVRAHRPLADFLPFCRLPTELRVKIWKYTLPAKSCGDDSRMVCLGAFHRGDAKLSFYHDSFLIKDRKNGRSNQAITGCFELNLLTVCKEARCIYLETFKHTLPLWAGNALHFDDSTTLYFPEFDRIVAELPNAMALDYQISACFNGVQRLQIGYETFLYCTMTFPNFQMGDIVKLIWSFQGLRLLTIERTPSRFGMVSSLVERTIGDLKKGLEAHKRYGDTSYTVPVIELMD